MNFTQHFTNVETAELIAKVLYILLKETKSNITYRLQENTECAD